MNRLASLLLVFWLLTPAARDELSKITGTQIVSGYAELERPTTGMIYARGIMDGVEIDVTVNWVEGMPAWIKYERGKVQL